MAFAPVLFCGKILSIERLCLDVLGETGTERAKQMTRNILTFIFLTLFSQTASAHKCVLNGNTAAEITAYNSCKNDLATGTAGHQDQRLQERIIELEREKQSLERKLLMLRERLLNVLRLTD